MTKRPKFTLSFTPAAVEHLDFIDVKYHSLLRRAIHEQLTYTATDQTRNRKPLIQPAPFNATWGNCGVALGIGFASFTTPTRSRRRS